MQIPACDEGVENRMPRTGLMRAIALAVAFVTTGYHAEGLSIDHRSRIPLVLSGGNRRATASLAATSLSASGDDDYDDYRDNSRRLSSWFASTPVIVSSVVL